ncbi:hypothetical protein TPB0596_04560 [Tsukamurella pulmonis]|nr:hypothetical protein TPB0596_04560 [Tsukamurella pulmonis]
MQPAGTIVTELKPNARTRKSCCAAEANSGTWVCATEPVTQVSELFMQVETYSERRRDDGAAVTP